MSANRLDTREYCRLKEEIYNVYVYNIDFPEKKKLEKFQRRVHEICDNPLYDKIISDTIQFPYDMELFNYLDGRNINPDDIADVVNEFGISYELLQSKIKEYMAYGYRTCVERGLIDYDIILELSKHFSSLSEEKNNKSVDF